MQLNSELERYKAEARKNLNSEKVGSCESGEEMRSKAHLATLKRINNSPDLASGNVRRSSMNLV